MGRRAIAWSRSQEGQAVLRRARRGHRRARKRKQKWLSGFDTKGEAERGLTEALSAVDRGRIHPKIVSERLRHASTSFTLDVYSHVTPSMQQQAADVMSSLLTG